MKNIRNKMCATIILFLISMVLLGNTSKQPEKPIVTVQSEAANSVFSIVFSPDGKYVMSENENNALTLWDVTSGKEIQTFKHSSSITFEAFSPDSKFIVSVSKDNVFKLWEVISGKEIRSFKLPSGNVTAIVFSPDGKFMLSGSDDNIIRLWDAASGKEIRSFTGHSSYIASVAFSSDGKWAISGGGDNTIKLWDVASGKEIRSFIGHTDEVNYVTFSPDGKSVLSRSQDETIRLWNVFSGKEIRSIGREWWDIIHIRHIRFTAFTPDSQFALSGGGSGENIITLWDVYSGKKIESYEIKGSKEYESASLSADGRFSLSGKGDTAVRLWDISSGKEICQMFSFEDGEWVVITPEGYYNASSNGGKYLNVRIGKAVYGIEQYKSIYFRPDIVQLSLKYNDSQKAIAMAQKSAEFKPEITAKPSEDDRTPPKLEIFEPTVKETKEKEIVIKGKASDKSGILEIVINNTQATVSGTSGEFWGKIPLVFGENRIEIKAVDGKNNTAKESIIIVRKGEDIPSDPDMQTGVYHALLIAVEKYDDTSVRNLDYPVSDIRKVKEILRTDYAFDEQNIRVLENPDRKMILNEFDRLEKNLTPKDNLLIFYAGHGHWDDKMKQGFWLPRNAIAEDRSEWLSNGFIRDYIRGIKTQHTLLISDACFSGGIFKTRQAFLESQKSIQRIYNLPSRRAITSGVMETVPDRSVFVEYLLKRLKDNENKYLNAQKLYVDTQDAVINNSPTSQKPEYGVIQETGDEGGDFIFMKRK